MGDVIMFVPRPNPNREQLIEQARANYESIFPSLAVEIFAQIGGALDISGQVEDPKDSA